MAPHGFTKEHSEPRSHIFMLMDQLIVDRGYGGRFQPRDWTALTDGKGAETQLWSVLLKDAEPATSDQKIFMPQTAAASNPVCLNCKTQDHILKWKYMGDPDPKAQWSRTSKVVDFVRDLKQPMNCYSCHDPHSTGPRVVRDALIEAVVDRVSLENHRLAKRAKDIGSAAVLISLLMVIVVWVCVLLESL